MPGRRIRARTSYLSRQSPHNKVTTPRRVVIPSAAERSRLLSAWLKSAFERKSPARGAFAVSKSSSVSVTTPTNGGHPERERSGRDPSAGFSFVGDARSRSRRISPPPLVFPPRLFRVERGKRYYLRPATSPGKKIWLRPPSSSRGSYLFLSNGSHPLRV